MKVVKLETSFIKKKTRDKEQPVHWQHFIVCGKRDQWVLVYICDENAETGCNHTVLIPNDRSTSLWEEIHESRED